MIALRSRLALLPKKASNIVLKFISCCILFLDSFNQFAKIILFFQKSEKNGDYLRLALKRVKPN